MSNANGKEVDTTSLSLDHAEQRGFIHRDYLAHCLRWTHVANYLHQKKRYQTHHVLDVGCGKEAPLAKLLFSSRLTHTTGSFTGVDYGKVPWPSTISENNPKFKAKFLSKFDFAKDALPRKNFDTIVSFEVLEHVEPFHAYNMLKRMGEVCAKDGRIFISTPCYDKKTGAADNHVNEMTYQGLEALIGFAGLKIEKVYGTFASQKDYKHLMTMAEKAVFASLNEYYDSNVVSCLMAPLYPKNSRNCIWVLSPGKVVIPEAPYIKSLSMDIHSSSEKWADHLKKVIADAKKRLK